MIVNPKGTNDGYDRVSRGGCFFYGNGNVTISYRYYCFSEPLGAARDTGFRVVLFPVRKSFWNFLKDL